MRCPTCGASESKVVDSRPSEDDLSIRRRRQCLGCGRRFTTYERLGDNPLIVVKSDGSSEAYDREKLMRGLLIACAKRPVSPEQIGTLIDGIENDLRNASVGEIRSADLGDLVLQKLSGFDEVAYVRFASVYKDFQSLEEFASALEAFRRHE
ncbi:transcriptional regulator NrdR [Xiamenia xianingshaonis]|uniref:Transcriptional repressor NrdR n=1 Tax=Xiamenia xianingshaonis TaxID=2682776 RepID=A0A9E6MRN1_9ACTN|nr:transcriptional regulator NrdR [Xiamenia xianingshaonis]NGM17077.1 transcriptional repressor NrdR [Eggerthellaceae bacterium zg-893]NHM13761.1 transcriptional repressor NrdR [Xiamenia xianingshaonis]NHM16955.1 transcriptional repressor NrdR [Xiamenia xianingshaonis]QTU85128.1 transcriptional repressor NrdR [Xiamenia xianingshaonis]